MHGRLLPGAAHDKYWFGLHTNAKMPASYGANVNLGELAQAWRTESRCKTEIVIMMFISNVFAEGIHAHNHILKAVLVCSRAFVYCAHTRSSLLA